MGEARASFCRKLVEAQEEREQDVKQWRWKINHASRGVVVNGLGNEISWTRGKKGARSISDQAPGAPLRQVSNLCIC
jgi:hypothetical protein